MRHENVSLLTEASCMTPKRLKFTLLKTTLEWKKRRNLEDQSQTELLQNNSQSFKNAYLCVNSDFRLFVWFSDDVFYVMEIFT